LRIIQTGVEDLLFCKKMGALHMVHFMAKEKLFACWLESL
jgi:hypothetical protein